MEPVQDAGQGVEGGTPMVGHPRAVHPGPDTNNVIESPGRMVNSCAPEVGPTWLPSPSIWMIESFQDAIRIPMTSPPNPADHPWDSS